MIRKMIEMIEDREVQPTNKDKEFINSSKLKAK